MRAISGGKDCGECPEARIELKDIGAVCAAQAAVNFVQACLAQTAPFLVLPLKNSSEKLKATDLFFFDIFDIIAYTIFVNRYKSIIVVR